MKTLFFYVICLLFTISANAQHRPLVDTVLQRAASRFLGDTSRAGLSVGIFHRGKTSTYDFGTVEKGKTIPPTSRTIYEIGSISKTFTGLLLARAIADGKITLEDDVRQYLDGDYPNLEYQHEPVRVIHLVNHTSGLPRFLPDREDIFQHRMDSVPFLLSDLHRNYSKNRFMDDLHQVKIDTVPGYNYKYSNTAAQLLGFILENIYHTTFDELIARYIAQPLGMTQTSASLPTRMEHLAQGYDASGTDMPYSPVLSKAAGGIYSTVSDMLKYLRFQLDETGKVVQLAHRVTQTYSDSAGITVYWRMNTTPTGLRKYWHTGGTFGFSSYCVFYPQIDTGIILLSNEFDLESQGELIKIAEKILEVLQRN